MRRILLVGILTYIGIQVSIKCKYAREWEIKEDAETTPPLNRPDSTIEFHPKIHRNKTRPLNLPDIENPEDNDLEPITDF